MQTGQSWTVTGYKAIFGVCLAFSLLAAAPAFAATAGSAVPNFPGVINLGETVAVTLTISNTSGGVPQGTESAIVLTTAPIPPNGIFFTPSCGAGTGVCDPGQEDPGVFSVTNGTGRVGTACATITFAAGAPDGTTGEIQFTPSSTVILGPASVGGLAAQCIIDFSVKALKVPTKDSLPDVGNPGIQTKQLAHARLQSTPSGTSATTTGFDDTTVTTPNLVVTKTPDGGTVISGQVATFTIVVDNTTGSGAATNVHLTDPLPAGLTWVLTSPVVPVADCAISGLPNAQTLSCTTLTVPAGASQTFVVSATTSLAACTTWTNTATVTETNTFAYPTTPVNLQPRDTGDITCIRRTTDLIISKTDGVTAVNAGGSTTYTVTVTNVGPFDVTNATVTDPAPLGLTLGAWTCAVANPGAGVGTTACGALSGSGPLNTTASLKAGGSVAYTIAATVTATTGTVTNTATVTPPADTLNSGQSCVTSGGITRSFNVQTGACSSSDTDAVNPIVDLLISKTNGTSSLTLGASTTYTVTVTNNGPSEITGAAVTDPAPVGLTLGAWTCVVTNPGSGGVVTTACGAASGSGPLNTTASLKVGGTVTYTIAATVTALGGSVTNTATVTPPGGTTNTGSSCVSSGGITRSFNVQTGACSSSDTDTIGLFSFSISKVPSAPNLAPNSPLTFTINVTNNGPSDASGSLLTDPGITGFTASGVTCTFAGNGAACPATTLAALQGSGVVLTTFPSLGTLTFSLTGTFTATSGSITNLARVCPSPNLTDLVSCVPTQTTVSVIVPNTQIPTLSEYALIALMLLLAAAGATYIRRVRRY